MRELDKAAFIRIQQICFDALHAVDGDAIEALEEIEDLVEEILEIENGKESA